MITPRLESEKKKLKHSTKPHTSSAQSCSTQTPSPTHAIIPTPTGCSISKCTKTSPRKPNFFHKSQPREHHMRSRRKRIEGARPSMSSLPEDNAGSDPPVGRGDVVLSGVVLLFMALTFAFVLYHYFTVSRRGARDGAGVSSSAQRGTFRGGDAAAGTAGGRGVDPAGLRALPVTVYRAKDRAGEAPECAVCLAELADGEVARFLPSCGHGFHAECVDLWLRGHSTCPLCRVDVDKTDALSSPSPLALPPALPEPANYATNLPTNVLFWGSQDAVMTARTVGGGPCSPGGASAALVIEVRETAPAVAPPRESETAKAQGLARLSSLKRLWKRGRHEAAATSSRPCRRATAGDDTEQAPASPLDIWNLT
ncbi:E3 ubiquitin-protein ligase EL5-like [Phragmites australis]|uniref:E3 ubiquitin-protein ligase EL5-like n=1 Tax=Phragmites australis TaxID=29695 RepID=UPI002D78E851|nr:E3 ubiquitin-protein ligase EL5-like [Phragmites australis]